MIPFPDCCKDCKPPKRSVGCHGRCKEYMDSKESHAQRTEQYKRERKKESDACAVMLDSMERAVKRNHSRGEWKGSE
jgi:hypothetical protein